MNLMRLSSAIESHGLTPPTLASVSSMDRLHSASSDSITHSPNGSTLSRGSSRRGLLTTQDVHSSSVASISTHGSHESATPLSRNDSQRSNISMQSVLDRDTLLKQQNQLYLSSFHKTRYIMTFFTILHLTPQLIIIALIATGLACSIYFQVNGMFPGFLVQYLICSLIGVYFLVTETIFAILYFKASRKCSDTLSTSIIVFLSIHLSLLLCANLLSVGFVMYSPLSALPMAYSVFKFCYSWLPAYLYAKAVYTTRNRVLKRRFRNNLRNLARHHGLDEQSARLVMTASGQYVLLVRPGNNGSADNGANEADDLPPVDVNKFPTVNFSKSTLDEAEAGVNPGKTASLEVRFDTCSICLDEFQEKCKISELTCSHWFHYKCISKWLESGKHASCPVCRLDLRAATAEKDKEDAVKSEESPPFTSATNSSEGQPLNAPAWTDEPTLRVDVQAVSPAPHVTVSPCTPLNSDGASPMHHDLINTPVESYTSSRNSPLTLESDDECDNLEDASAEVSTLRNLFGRRPSSAPSPDSPLSRRYASQQRPSHFIYNQTPKKTSREPPV